MHKVPKIARLVAAFLTLALSGCGSLYLHNDAAQQATAKAKTELDKVDVTAVFDNEAAYLDDLQKREYAAVAENLGAQRDDSLLKILRGKAGSAGDGRSFLAARVDGYLNAVAGTADRGGTTKLSRIIQSANESVGNTRTLAKALDEELKKPGNDLKPLPGATIPNLPSPSGLTLRDAIDAVLSGETALAGKQAAAKVAKTELETNLAKAAEDLSAGNASQETFTKLLTKVNEFLQKAKDESNPYISEAISESLLDSVDHLIDVTDPTGLGTGAATDSKARAAIGFVHAAFGVGDAFSNPPRVPHPNALAATEAWLRYVASEASTALIEAQENQAVLRARLVAVTQQVYYLSLAGQELESLQPIALKKDEGLAKLLADQNLQMSHAASAASYYYSTAWSKGFIPAQQLNEVAEPLVERRAKLQQSRQSADAWLGTLKPVVATLVAYGEGGIDAHLLAELLQVLGITAIAAGVN